MTSRVAACNVVHWRVQIRFNGSSASDRFPPQKEKGGGSGAAFQASAPLGSKKFYFCRRQNGAVRPRRNPPGRASRESKTGREKNSETRLRGKRARRAARALRTRRMRHKQIQKVKRRSLFLRSLLLRSLSREMSRNIAKTTVFASGG